ncbi:hypothetical protein [Mesorhizobium sp. ANAO-SY3R2]|uniref:hypothetical protein n=1 Tax=Mesorhizobium sp. ANAO-SY3R2 TaxID=3166644 RepID=UPI00366D9F4B
MREVTPPTPIRPAVVLPPEASAEEVADFTRGVAILERLARRTAELASENGKETDQ